jgi:hypothetical protein
VVGGDYVGRNKRILSAHKVYFGKLAALSGAICAPFLFEKFS